jgi:hypothetical protein
MTLQTADISRMTALLAAIAKQLDIITRHILPVAPNYRYPLKKYWQFNWDGIDASVLRRDEEGPTLVKWGNYTWKRRSGAGKFGKAVWFSRPDGKDENGDTRYRRLVTFKDWSDPEPMDERAANERAAQTDSQTQATQVTNAVTVSRTPSVANNGNGNRANYSTTQTVSAPVSSLSEDWESYARQTDDPVLFDQCFFNANPQWNNFGMVTRVRDLIGDITQLGGNLMYDALAAYAAEFPSQRKQYDATTAHSLALQAAQAILPTPETSAESIPVPA